ncbi:hypothetical protein LTS18_003625 [Coniosporium uncinatum]|uniref:Uncharacterized protein n=1 Tax=Coniosporium uncinatum TaxID=93489 RepID=A0ACC3D6K4_9PEZI|nr:hypothetical protein LTS18_003625 [Coniosporium uncinatum]
MLTVHHLQRSQSERIVWLCEELGIQYNLKSYERDPKTLLGPSEIKGLTPMGGAPAITDGSITIGETTACAEYILTKYGSGKLVVKPDASNYADYLYWLHFANGTLQPNISRSMWFGFAGLGPDSDNPIVQRSLGGMRKALQVIDDRVKQSTWLAGEEFTAADVMSVFSLTTMRLFSPFSLDDYPGIVGYLERVGKREAYQKAMEKGDPGLKPLLGKEKPEPIARKL